MSWWITVDDLVLPRQLAGHPALELVNSRSGWGEPFHERQEFLRAHFDGHAIRPLSEQDSSALGTLAAANALIDRPAHAPAVDFNGVVSCFHLGCGGIA